MDVFKALGGWGFDLAGAFSGEQKFIIRLTPKAYELLFSWPRFVRFSARGIRRK